jgi:hypothetical protein
MLANAPTHAGRLTCPNPCSHSDTNTCVCMRMPPCAWTQSPMRTCAPKHARAHAHAHMHMHACACTPHHTACMHTARQLHLKNILSGASCLCTPRMWWCCAASCAAVACHARLFTSGYAAASSWKRAAGTSSACTMLSAVRLPMRGRESISSHTPRASPAGGAGRGGVGAGRALGTRGARGRRERAASQAWLAVVVEGGRNDL